MGDGRGCAGCTPSKGSSDEFSVNLKMLLTKGLVVPTVNGLKYIDEMGQTHRASILPSGSIQANATGGRVYRTVQSWLASFLMLPQTNKTRWNVAIKRVRYGNTPLWRLFKKAKSIKCEK